MVTAEVLVPVLDFGLANRVASVRCARSGEVRTSAREGVVVRGGVAHLPAVPLGSEAGLLLVRFADGVAAWVRPGEGEGGRCDGCAG